MSGIDGFETAKRIRDIDLEVDIVFVTYQKESIARGYDYNAKGYLYKNVTEEQIAERMDKVISERLRASNEGLMKVKLIKGNHILLSLSGVQYFESSGHVITAVSEKEKHQFRDTISNLTDLLENKGFIRVSRSHLVNINYIFHLVGNQIIIRQNEKITVGRAYKQSIESALKRRETEKWRI